MSYQYSYAYSDGYPALVSVLGMVIQLLTTVWGVAMYAAVSYTYYSIAQRRAISKPWLAWIPVVRSWVLGSISDQYRYVVRAEVKSKRKLLLILDILGTILKIAFAVLAFAVVAAAMIMPYLGRHPAYGNLQQLILLFGGVTLAFVAVGIIYLIVYYIALNDLYRSCDPRNSTAFLVVSILFPVVKPFLLFFGCKKDDGMPPRRETVVYPEKDEEAPDPEMFE